MAGKQVHRPVNLVMQQLRRYVAKARAAPKRVRQQGHLLDGRSRLRDPADRLGRPAGTSCTRVLSRRQYGASRHVP